MPFELNEEQRQAVAALRGPVLISAGAGSGKTRTLSERFAHALEADEGEGWDGAAPGRILTITFTEKAAGELSERVRSTLRAAGKRRAAQEIDSAWISTIHGFCSRILRRYALEAGLDPAFAVADSIAAKRLEDAAFEKATEVALGSREGQVLFGDLEFSVVYKATMTAVRQLRTRGLGADSLVIDAPRAASALHSEACDCLRDASSRLRECGDIGVRGNGFCDACDAALAELSGLETGELDEAEAAKVVWRALAPIKFGSVSAKAKVVHAEVAALIGKLTGEAATAAAHPYARALSALVGEYMSAYSASKREQGLLDFDDLQYETLRLFQERPDVLAECRELFALSMVDEFQDTDALQLALVTSVAGEDLCTVGDEHQSIYGFRGADISVFRKHEQRMMAAGARSRDLRANYRSHGAVLDFVNRLFSSPVLFGEDLLHLTHGRVEKVPPRVPDDEPRIDVVVVHKTGSADEARRDEAVAIAKRFARLRDEHSFSGGEMAILVRSYSNAEIYAQALRDHDFDAMVVGGSRFLTLPEVQVARMLVRSMANHHDEVALVQLLSGDAGRMSDDGLLLLRGISNSMWAALASPPQELCSLNAGRATAVKAALDRANARMGHVPLSEIVLRAVEELGLDLVLLSRGDQGRQAYANVLKFARMAADFESGSGAGPAAFAAYLDAREEYGEHTPPATLGDDESSAVRIMSVHAAKGLEFPVVAVVGLGSSVSGEAQVVRLGRPATGEGLALAVQLPNGKRFREKANRPPLFTRLDDLAKQAETEEGKRVFYVACTRAQEVLVLSGMADMTKEPTASEHMMNWLRLALPEVDASVGDGPVIHQCGEWPLRAEAIAMGDEQGCEAEPSQPERRELDVAQVTDTSDFTLALPERLSYTDLALYSECRKRFWAQRVLRVGTLQLESENDSRRLGSALHAVLQLAEDELPEASRVEALCDHHRISDAGREQVVLAAERFLKSRAAGELADCNLVRREWPFVLDLGSGCGPLTFGGAIDAYGRSGSRGLVVDYKSGASGEEQELEARYRLQARCYALVALKDGCDRVKVIFSRPQVAAADGSCQQVEFEFAVDDADSIAAEIQEAHQRMSTGQYPPLDTWDPQVCAECPVLGSLCDVHAPKGFGRG